MQSFVVVVETGGHVLQIVMNGAANNTRGAPLCLAAASCIACQVFKKIKTFINNLHGYKR